jgi:hypothetical protein
MKKDQPHVTREETDPERVNKLSRVTQLVGGVVILIQVSFSFFSMDFLM